MAKISDKKEPLIITAAICGAEVTREQNPNLPITAEELAEEAYKCCKEGASVIHLHVRNKDGTPTQDKDVFKEAIEAIKEKTKKFNPIIQPSTGGAVGMSMKERLQPIGLSPEYASFDVGSMNFGDEPFLNTYPDVKEAAKMFNKFNVKPEFEVFNFDGLMQMEYLLKEGFFKGHVHANMVMGVAVPAEPKYLLMLVEALPEDATWTVMGLGRFQDRMVMMSIACGGHVRVGLEDNIYLEKGVLAKGSYEFVAKVRNMAEVFGRPIATPDEARKIIGIKGGL